MSENPLQLPLDISGLPEFKMPDSGVVPVWLHGQNDTKIRIGSATLEGRKVTLEFVDNDLGEHMYEQLSQDKNIGLISKEE